MSGVYDVIVIGGGIVGAATAMKILEKKKLSLLLIEAEPRLAAHQTGNNSGVVHSGLYYKPGSLKAENCTRGREMMYRFCDENSIPFDRCGKIVVAVNKDELPKLISLEERGRANGLSEIRRLRAEEIKEYEPHAAGIAGLWVPYTGITDYTKITETYGKLIETYGGEVRTNCRFLSLHNKGNYILETTLGSFATRFVINCGGLQSDRIARICGVEPNVKIVPFRGEYYHINKDREYLVRNLIYPVPDPQFPFLGVHFTRMIGGGREAGPNAVLAYKREGYSHTEISVVDSVELLAYPGFWKMAAKYYGMGFREFHRSLSKKAFVNSLRKLIPEISETDVHRGGAGVRAQALLPDGRLLDDFCIVEAENMIHLLNAPSPAATASLSIGDTMSDLALKRIH